MPTFSSAQVTDPFLSTNELLAPMLAHVDAQSKLGTLDINRQRLGLEQRKLDLQQSGGDALIRSLTGGDGTTGAGGAGAGGGSFLDALAAIESGDKNIVSGVDKDSRGLTLAQGGNPTEISQGHFQIQTATWRDFAKQAGVDVNQFPTAMSAPREVQAQVASVIPLSRFGPRTQTLLRSRFGPLDTNQTVGALAGTPSLTFAPGTAGPRVTTAPPPPFNPNAGPRVAGAPPAGAPPGFAPLVPVPRAPTVTGQADPASMEAVKKASVALLAMPEADAAVAYGPTVKALQAQGLAMNAPPEYPGHAALQAIVGQGETTTPAVEPSRVALRLGGTDTAGPGAGQVTMAPVEAPNTLYQTGLPGITIRGPGNPLAPPPVTTQAPATQPAATQPPAPLTRPPPLQPPSAPSRTIPLEPVLPSGLTAGQVRLAASMVQSGAPVADVAAHVEQWRQANLSGRQQAATQAALDAAAQFERQKYYQEQQQKAEQTDYQRRQDAETARRNSEADKRAEQAAKDRNLPPGWRLSEDGKTAYLVAGLTDPEVGKQTERTFNQENKLRDEFQKLTGDFRIVQTSFENIRSAAKANDGAGDMSMLYNYVRLLDPTSVVRESEFAAAAASGSFGQRVQGAVERVLSGARMPESLRESFIREGKNLYNNQLRSHNTIADQYEKLARDNGLEPGRVVTRFARSQDDAEPPVVKSDEDFNKLPSGAVFKDPEGHIRKKP